VSGGRRYAVAFVAVLVAAACLGLAGLGSLRSTTLLWASIGCSFVAAIGGIAALAAGRRR
jgi:hypothetical protein